mmetsp:Transcript_54022/g.128700  ORF Transcript_54022/g.128700 Transcript_54022/m.128700 type:complete len:211 (+) Transcript_54022:293-925(+)
MCPILAKHAQVDFRNILCVHEHPAGSTPELRQAPAQHHGSEEVLMTRLPIYQGCVGNALRGGRCWLWRWQAAVTTAKLADSTHKTERKGTSAPRAPRNLLSSVGCSVYAGQNRSRLQERTWSLRSLRNPFFQMKSHLCLLSQSGLRVELLQHKFLLSNRKRTKGSQYLFRSLRWTETRHGQCTHSSITGARPIGRALSSSAFSAQATAIL